MSGSFGKCIKGQNKNEKQINFMTSGASTDINNLTEQRQTFAGLVFVYKTVLCTCVTRLVWSKVVNHTVAFATIEEEEVPVRSVSLGESLKGKTGRN